MISKVSLISYEKHQIVSEIPCGKCSSIDTRHYTRASLLLDHPRSRGRSELQQPEPHLNKIDHINEMHHFLKKVILRKCEITTDLCNMEKIGKTLDRW